MSGRRTRRFGGRLGRFLWELSHALGRVSAEYKDIARTRRDGTRQWDALVYLRELPRRDFERLRDALMQGEKVAAVSDFPVAPPRRTAALLFQVPAVSADAAAALALGEARRALALAGLVADRTCRVEVEPAAPPPVPPDDRPVSE